MRDADRVVGLLEASDVKHTKLLVNRLKPAMVQEDQMMSVRDVLDILAVPLLGVVPDDERVIVSSNRGEPLVLDAKLSWLGSPLPMWPVACWAKRCPCSTSPPPTTISSAASAASFGTRAARLLNSDCP